MSEDPSLRPRRADPPVDRTESPPQAGRESPSADEIRRIVAVAEALRIDPQTARIALRDETGRIPTDPDLRRSVAAAATALDSGSQAV